MAKRPHESGRPCKLFLTLLTVAGTCLAAYFLLSPLLPNPYSSQISLHRVAWNSADLNITGCCRGLEHTELWSEAVKWGSDFLLNSTQACCDACRNHPRCNSWVYCADQAKCGDFYRQVIYTSQHSCLLSSRWLVNNLMVFFHLSCDTIKSL